MDIEASVLRIVHGDDLPTGDGVHCLLAPDGEVLNQWVCSGAGWAKHDLHDRHPEKIKEWQERFGDYRIMQDA